MLSPIEYGVLSLVLASRLPPKATGVIVVAQRPSVESNLPDLAAYKKLGAFNKFPSLATETVSDLLVKEKEAAEFELKFSLPRPVKLLGSEEAQRVFRGRADWVSFYEAFPESGGMFFLSRVGFNSNTSQALVHVGRQWLGRAGSGSLVFLEKRDELFAEVGEVPTWLS